MSARRKLGEYTLIMKWEPDVPRRQPWCLGTYKWSIRRTGKNRGGDSGWFHVWSKDSKQVNSSRTRGSVSIVELGVSESSLDKKVAYDAVGLMIVRDLLDRYPNMIHYQALLAHAYVNALKSGAIDSNDLASAPERTQMLVDELLGVKAGG